MNKETRSYNADYTVEGNTLTGYAAMYNKRSLLITERGRQFYEYVKPEAFKRSLAENNDIQITFNHGELFLGRTSSGTGKVWDDGLGLRFSVDIPQYANQVREMVERKDLTGCSFMFGVRKDNWLDKSTRELVDLDLMECGPVLQPAYPSATLDGIRSMEIMRKRLDLIEKINRRA